MDNNRNKLNARLLEVLGKEKDILIKLINRILKETAFDLLSKVMDNVEDRRVKWTTYRNINSWFINWEHDLEELGFSYRDDDRGLIVPEK